MGQPTWPSIPPPSVNDNLTSNPCITRGVNYNGLREWRPLKTANWCYTCGCMAAGQSPLARAWAAAQADRQPCLTHSAADSGVSRNLRQGVRKVVLYWFRVPIFFTYRPKQLRSQVQKIMYFPDRGCFFLTLHWPHPNSLTFTVFHKSCNPTSGGGELCSGVWITPCPRLPI